MSREWRAAAENSRLFQPSGGAAGMEVEPHTRPRALAALIRWSSSFWNPRIPQLVLASSDIKPDGAGAGAAATAGAGVTAGLRPTVEARHSMDKR